MFVLDHSYWTLRLAHNTLYTPSQYTEVFGELWCKVTNRTRRSWDYKYSHCCFPSWSMMYIKQMGEKHWGIHSTESALINLLIYSMWHSCLRPYPLHCSNQRGMMGESISCNAAKVQNCPNSSQSHQTTAYSQPLPACGLISLYDIFWFCPVHLPPSDVRRWHSNVVVCQHLQNTYKPLFPSRD